MSYSDKKQILCEVLGEHKTSGDELLFYCPECRHHKLKLSCNIKKNNWKCWVCEFRGNNLYRLIKRYGTRSHVEAWKKFLDQIEDHSKLDEYLEEVFSVKKGHSNQVISLPKEFISLIKAPNEKQFREPLKYLVSRGMTKEALYLYKPGICLEGEYHHRVIFPSVDMCGQINFFVGRTYIHDYIKYSNAKCSSDIIFNEPYVDWDKDIVLVEGIFSTIKFGSNALPLFGSKLSDTKNIFKKCVIHDSNVYFALDTDAESKTLSIINAMHQYDLNVYKIDISPFASADEMTKEQFQEKKEQAIKIEPTNMLELKLNSILKGA